MNQSNFFKFRKTRSFDRKYVAYAKGNKNLQKRIDAILILLSIDPYHVSPRTHKVTTKRFGDIRSSRVTGDIRILWKIDDDILHLIILLDIGGHSGKKKVY